METIKTIHKRRSIRQFNKKEISQQDIDKILSAGMTAPSAMNKQSWRIVLITDDKIKQKITEISKYAQMVKDSPLSILVCGDKEASFGECWIFDCSACIQNMLLSACALGIGSVWTGINTEQRKEFAKLFNLPDNIIPHSLVVFGYSDLPFEEKDYFDKSKVHLNKW
ncbi:MAG TPA: nitroreductase family protein [Rickettsiales bacterium]|nr:nitroreductase family protein [Rickettsiales bacterium]